MNIPPPFVLAVLFSTVTLVIWVFCPVISIAPPLVLVAVLFTNVEPSIVVLEPLILTAPPSVAVFPSNSQLMILALPPSPSI